MTCYHPLQGFRSKEVNSSGKRSIVFNRKFGYSDLPIAVPCGQCIGCRLERSRQWAIRCQHEASLYADNCFITLTFDDQHLPSDRSLDVRVFQLFMKKLRKKFQGLTPVHDSETGETTFPIRFYHCGEYGETFGRPHYHALIFNFDFPDKVLFSVREGNRLYTSASLQELWPFGFATIGSATFESAAYVARYIMKKRFGDDADAHYNGRKPEYTTMSRRPGIGARWFEKYVSDVYPHDRVIIRAKQMRPPKYYDRMFELYSPSEYSLIKRKRVLAAKNNLDDQTPDRLLVKERVHKARITKLVRGVDDVT